MKYLIVILVLSGFNIQFAAAQGQKWISYEPRKSAFNGKHIVLISGDEGYRSEEALPMLANILSKRHGFKTTVLFAIDPKTGEVNPNVQNNIPGLHNLEDADLMVNFVRFRELPNQQMKYIDEYIQSGKPIIGLRTSTHAFRYESDSDSPYSKYDFRSNVAGWTGGYGEKIHGETWIDHHGEISKESTRGLVNGLNQRNNNPILNGISDIWTVTDVYGINDLPANANVLVWGALTDGKSPESEINWTKSILPVAWTNHYTSDTGNTGRVFTTTMGAAVDLQNEDLRRLLVNACYWAVGMENKTPKKSNVDIIGEYNPTGYGFDKYQKGMTPADFK